jgi:hypothetical protein
VVDTLGMSQEAIKTASMVPNSGATIRWTPQAIEVPIPRSQWLFSTH